jgi:hypothetical protein
MNGSMARTGETVLISFLLQLLICILRSLKSYKFTTEIDQWSLLASCHWLIIVRSGGSSVLTGLVIQLTLFPDLGQDDWDKSLSEIVLNPRVKAAGCTLYREGVSVLHLL